MNLYKVYEKGEEWGAYVFAERAGLAKAYFARFGPSYYPPDYIDIRAELIGKTDKVTEITLVDDDKDSLYPIVLELGGRFDYEDEDEENEE